MRIHRGVVQALTGDGDGGAAVASGGPGRTPTGVRGVAGEDGGDAGRRGTAGTAEQAGVGVPVPAEGGDLAGLAALGVDDLEFVAGRQQ